MWGIDFEEAGNSLICGHAVFSIPDTHKTYQVRFYPDVGMVIEEQAEVDGKWGWKIIKNRAQPEDLEAILPDNFGHKWSYGDFLIAMTFFDEGHKRGYARGEWKANERNAKRNKAAA